MPTLYITEPGSTLRRSGGSLKVTQDIDPDGKGPKPRKRKELIEVEPHRLEMIGFVGRGTTLSGHALDLCLESGIHIAWFSRSGRYRARLIPELPRAGELRLGQYQLALDEELKLEFSRTIIAAKLENSVGVLKTWRSNRPGNAPLERTFAALKNASSGAAAATNESELLGHEGMAARAWFQALAECVPKTFGFSGRARRPPTDPVNALLSLGYSLLVNWIAGRIEGRGLDVSLGLCHHSRPGRPALALDLVEELRQPVVDRFVVRTLNLQILQPKHFEENEGGVRLTREGMKIFFREWERHWALPLSEQGASNVGATITEQIEGFVRHVRGASKYEPFLLRGQA